MTLNTFLCSILSIILPWIGPCDDDGGIYPVAVGCEGKTSGDTWNCHCRTGMAHMTDNYTKVYNQCDLAKEHGAIHGSAIVDLVPSEMGLAVYSGTSRSICGGSEKACQCTCFDQAAVDGAVGFRTNTSLGGTPGYITDCLGLCGANCVHGDGMGGRYASILIHDVCQSYIQSREPMPE